MSDTEESFGIQKPKAKGEETLSREKLGGRYNRLISLIPDQGIRLSKNVRTKLNSVDPSYCNPCMMIAGAIFLIKYGDDKKENTLKNLREVNNMCERYIYEDDIEFRDKLTRKTRPPEVAVLKDIYRAYRYILYSKTTEMDSININEGEEQYSESESEGSEGETEYENDNMF